MTAIAFSWIIDLTQATFLGNQLWQWVTVLSIVLAGLLASKPIGYLFARQSQRLAQSERLAVFAILLRSLVGPARLLVMAGAFYAASMFMNLTYHVVEAGKAGQSTTRTIELLPYWLNACRAMAVLAAGWFVYRLVDMIEHLLHRWATRSDTLIDKQLVPVIRKTLRAFIVVLVVLFVAQNIFEWNIGALLAGLGIGGLAVALAAQSAIANLFGSVTIFADRPFRIGELVKIKGYFGHVEEVGFRSTRIRTLEGNLVTIPNAVVATESVENLGPRPHIRRVLDLTLAAGTPPEKLTRAQEIIRQMLQDRQGSLAADMPPRIYLTDVSPAGLKLQVYYWFAPPQYWRFLEFNHEFNLDLLRRFGQEDIGFSLSN